MKDCILHITIDGFPEDAFHVVQFDGSEKLHDLFEFNIVIVAQPPGLDLDRALGARTRLTVRTQGEDAVFQGVAGAVENLHSSGAFTFHHVRMVPRLQHLALTSNNRVFLDKKLPDIVQEVLKGENGARKLDFELRLKRSHPSRDFICQYRESDLNFLARRLENEGAFYFFENGDDGEKVVIADDHVFQDCKTSPVKLIDASGLHHDDAPDAIHEFARRIQAEPVSVAVRDVNELNPIHDMRAEKDTPCAFTKGMSGECHIFAPNMRTREECEALADAVAKSYACECEQYKGAGRSPHFRPGCVFELQKAQNKSYNRRYLLTEVRHHGAQEGHLARVLGLKIGNGGNGKAPSYSNRFRAIPEDTVYRPARRTPRPTIHGVLNARIDAAGSGEYAELDEHGRYKVILPFDVSGRKDGKASAWVRMSQPYGGDGHGLHLPLHKGCEVGLMFLAGDPDRPIIAGALPNPENASPVTSKSAAANTVSTAHGNALHMGDERGAQYITLYNKDSDTVVRMGADPDLGKTDPAVQQKLAVVSAQGVNHNISSSTVMGATADSSGDASTDVSTEPSEDPPNQPDKPSKAPFAKKIDHKDSSGKHGFTFNTPKWFSVTAGAQYSVFFGESTDATLGLKLTAIGGIPNLPVISELTTGAGVFEGVMAKDPGLAPLAVQQLLPTKGAANLALEISANILADVSLKKLERDLNLSKLAVRLEGWRVTKRANKINAEKDVMQGKLDRLVEQKKLARAQADKLVGQKQELKKSVKKLRDEINKAKVEETRLVKKLETVCNEESKAYSELMKAAKTYQELVDEKNEVAGEIETIRASLNRAAEEKVGLAGNKNVLGGEISNVDTEKMVL